MLAAIESLEGVELTAELNKVGSPSDNIDFNRKQESGYLLTTTGKLYAPHLTHSHSL
jgi:hypothetical protein